MKNKESKDFFHVYFGGGLFSHKDIIGNSMLADAIRTVSNGKFRCLLPQNFEIRGKTTQEIRDYDIANLLECDAAIFNYDGAELDSGTVVEYMFAKFADIPSVLVRSDFRSGGDCIDMGTGKMLPWNLMTAFFPRTEYVVVNSAEYYKSFSSAQKDDFVNQSGVDCAKGMIEKYAKDIVIALESVIASDRTLDNSVADKVFEWIAKIPNFSNEILVKRVELALKNKLK